jgi:hypothetical protein
MQSHHLPHIEAISEREGVEEATIAVLAVECREEGDWSEL